MAKAFRQHPNLPEGFSDTFEERFWDKVFLMTEERGCWLWTAAQYPNGYGKASKGRSRTTVGAHVGSWLINRGPLPEGMCVLHHCDNPCCVRPDHLFIGTDKDNTQDMIKKGRHVFEIPDPRPGERNPMAKLTKEQVFEIRKLYVPRKMSQTKLARMFGVSQTEIGFIVRREHWNHI